MTAMQQWRNGGSFGTWTYTVPEDYELIDRGLQRASDYIVYTIKAGTYPVELTNIGGTEWNPDRDVNTPGFIANTGPYYAVVRVNAVKTREYYESEIFGHISGEPKDVHEETTYALRWYGYELSDSDARFTRVSDDSGDAR